MQVMQFAPVPNIVKGELSIDDMFPVFLVVALELLCKSDGFWVELGAGFVEG